MIGIVFPGQGSQEVGMGRGLADSYPEAHRTFEEADDLLGFSLSNLCFEGPEEKLRLTANTQPAILTVSVAAWRVMKERWSGAVRFFAGHSLGEYSALVAASVLPFSEAVRAVRERGRFMQEAVPEGRGAMAAIIGLEREQVEGVCREEAKGEVVGAANLNAPGQVVVAGHAAAVSRVCEAARAAGARKAMPLPVSAPFHCALMDPVRPRLRRVLEEVEMGGFEAPVVSNLTAEPVSDPARVVDLLVDQVVNPVRWEESMRLMLREGVSLMIEVGPGRVLGGLMKRIDRSVAMKNVADPRSLDAALFKGMQDGVRFQR